MGATVSPREHTVTDHAEPGRQAERKHVPRRRWTEQDQLQSIEQVAERRETEPDARSWPPGTASPGLTPPVFTPTISPEEIASYLGTSPWWVREQARTGRVQHLRLGKGRIRFLPEHVHELIALCTVEATESAPEGGASTPSVPASLASLGVTRRSQRAHGTHAVDGS